MTGKKIKKFFPDFYKKYKLKDTDELYLMGNKIKILRKGRVEQYGSLTPHQLVIKDKK